MVLPYFVYYDVVDGRVFVASCGGTITSWVGFSIDDGSRLFSGIAYGILAVAGRLAVCFVVLRIGADSYGIASFPWCAEYSLI